MVVHLHFAESPQFYDVKSVMFRLENVNFAVDVSR
jgi:hypothetical protein